MENNTVWVARDDDEPKQLRMYMNKPERENGVWNDESGEYINLGNILPEVTFEESPKRLGIVDYERERWHNMTKGEMPTKDEQGKHFLLYIPYNKRHERIKIGSWTNSIHFFWVSEPNYMGYYANKCYWKRIDLPDDYLDDVWDPDRLRMQNSKKD